MKQVSVFTAAVLVAALSALTIAAQETKATAARQQGAETRDWSAIDANKDHLISPDEMDKYLKEVWAKQRKKS